MKGRPGFIDLSVGRFYALFFSSLVFLVLMSLQNFDPSWADNLRDISRNLGGFFWQLMVVSEGRVNSDRSIILLWVATVISIFGFLVFLYTIPFSVVQDKYLKSNAILNVLLLIASCAFLAMIIAGAICVSFVLPVGDGKFSRIIAFIIHTDGGLSISFASLLVVEAYFLATALKTILGYIFIR
ncbi:hypothetical protein [Pseudomonas oryzihabitans]|uniref:hypothetical protein n=1 Tax=Pseudomonas oryzihabitans TaxID=47885 RepID=UPI002893F157|nr:hypothetical protein [Pseudomonas oryzihabitans]MDT3722092.1 hypothetical protein [Pseudomonas oryzihabitans]